MKRLLIGAFILVALIGLSLWALDRHTQQQYEEQVHSTKNRFTANKAAFESLTSEWRTLHPGLNECGLPDPQPGLVQFALIESKPGGGFRIARGMVDQIYRNADEASAAMKTDSATLQNFKEKAERLSVTAVLQHQSELKFMSESSSPIGVMFVPPKCPNAKFYRASAQSNSGPGFMIFQELTDNWYFYEDRN